MIKAHIQDSTYTLVLSKVIWTGTGILHGCINVLFTAYTGTYRYNKRNL